MSAEQLALPIQYGPAWYCQPALPELAPGVPALGDEYMDWRLWERLQDEAEEMLEAQYG